MLLLWAPFCDTKYYTTQMAYVMTCKILAKIMFNILWKWVCRNFNSWWNFVNFSFYIRLEGAHGKVVWLSSILVLLDIGQISIILVSKVRWSSSFSLPSIGNLFLCCKSSHIISVVSMLRPCHVWSSNEKLDESYVNIYPVLFEF